MRKRIIQALFLLMIPPLMAVNLWAINNYNPSSSPDSNSGKTPEEHDKNKTGDPIDVSTGDNLVREEGLRLATPGIPLSFDLQYNSGKKWIGMFGGQAAFGPGWDFSLNWRLSVVYKATYLVAAFPLGVMLTSSSCEYGAPLEDLMLSDGPLSAANPPGIPSEFLLIRCVLATKYYLISDGTTTYRVEGGWVNKPFGIVSDWDLNGGHYTEMPVDWELIHINNEYRLLFPGKKWLTFSDDGRMSAMGDAWGNTITRSRNGDTETYTHSNGRWLEFDWTSNLVSEIKTDDGRGMRFTYTDECLASVEWYCGVKNRAHLYHYTYYLLTERINAEGTASQYSYGAKYKANEVIVGESWYRHKVEDSRAHYYGHGTEWFEDYLYDSLGRLAGRIGPWNSSSPQGQQGVYYTYDNWRNIVAERYFERSNTATLMNRYDDHHRLLESTIGNGSTTQQLVSATWNANESLLSSVSDADGLALNLEYTNGTVSSASLGRQGTEETFFEGAEWNERGMPGVVRDARGAETHLAYNADGQATTIRPPAGPGYGFDYDTAGRIQKINRLEPGEVTRTLVEYQRDGFGQITEAAYPGGLFEFFTYDPMRRLIRVVDRAGRGTHLEYWPIGKIKSVTRYSGQEPVAGIRFDYDEQGTDLKVTDELDRIVEGYSLDPAGRAIAVANNLGQTLEITYALLDLPQTIVRFDNSTVNYTYDVAWRLANIVYPDDTVSMSYSGGGLLQTIGDLSGTITNKYDTLLRWAGQTCPAPGGVGPYEITVVNGTGGLPESLTSIGGTVQYAYDMGSRLSSISGPANTFNYSYNPTNGLIAGVSCSAINAAYAFDVLDRIKQIEWTAGANPVRKFNYDYNAVGMITQKVVTLNGQQTTNIYAYDSLDRLTSESSFSLQTSAVSLYMYDLAGNRTEMVQNGQTINYTLSAGNRLISWGTNGENTVGYNAAGCVTQICSGSSIKALAWDSRYRLTSITLSNAVERYGYDALDRRTSISDGATTNYLVYAGVHVIAEVGTSGSLVRSYTYGPGIDNILSMTVYGGTTSTYYYVKDHLGSVQAIVDSTGSIAESYRYDAWGNVLNVFDSSGNPIENRQSQIGNRYLWQGREYSWKTGLYFFRARWYEPITGRWLSNDPIGISGGLNQYVFCLDNPVNFVDPTGQKILFGKLRNIYCLFRAILQFLTGSLMPERVILDTTEKAITMVVKDTPKVVGTTIGIAATVAYFALTPSAIGGDEGAIEDFPGGDPNIPGDGGGSGSDSSGGPVSGLSGGPSSGGGSGFTPSRGAGTPGPAYRPPRRPRPGPNPWPRPSPGPNEPADTGKPF